MKKTLVWLHISDIHFHPQRDWNDSISRNSLLTMLRELFASNLDLRPDFVFCTGDIAFGEIKKFPMAKQYDAASDFFDQLLTVCGQNQEPLGVDKLFIVPGNHDVDRTAVNNDAQVALNAMSNDSHKNSQKINIRFSDLSKEYVDASKRLGPFGEFIKAKFPKLIYDHDRNYFLHTTKFNDLNIAVVGLNSAWSCAGDEDDRNMWTAVEWQMNNADVELRQANLRIGLMHHPLDWLNTAERDFARRRFSTEFDFFLHGHTHSAWVSPGSTQITLGAGAVGAEESAEFGFNITSINFEDGTANTHLFSKLSGASGWTKQLIPTHAPEGIWSYALPQRLKKGRANPVPSSGAAAAELALKRQFVRQLLEDDFKASLKMYSSLPSLWVEPALALAPETLKGAAKPSDAVDMSSLLLSPISIIIKAPPQYGSTALAKRLIQDAWANHEALWVYVDSEAIKPNKASLQDAITVYLDRLKCSVAEVQCLIVDSLSENDPRSTKIMRVAAELFAHVPIIGLARLYGGPEDQASAITKDTGRTFEKAYLHAMPRAKLRELVAGYNDVKFLGDEDFVTKRLAADLEVLNLHRTAYNCLTLLKVSELEFEESPVNRSEVIKRVLIMIFNSDSAPTYKTRPDLKDCEYVIGFFCESLIREGVYEFSRDRFLTQIQNFSKVQLIEIDTHFVFDVLYANNIIVKNGQLFKFKFSYWILYFAAHRMHHDSEFAAYIFDEMRYTRFPEIIEFYTGIDRRREDALRLLDADLKRSIEAVREKCGLPDALDPYKIATWKPSPAKELQMREEIANGVKASNLPDEIKDHYADRSYDAARPYNQNFSAVLNEKSVSCLFQTIRAASQALRNSDYASPESKKALIETILHAWDQVSKVLFVVLPPLASNGHASYDGTYFCLIDDFGSTNKERLLKILEAIPFNVASWYKDHLFSVKMGPLLYDQLNNKGLSSISVHELCLMLIMERPKDWAGKIRSHLASLPNNSYYLHDLYTMLRAQYSYGFASKSTLKEIEELIVFVATKHVRDEMNPGTKIISKTKFKTNPVPPRDISQIE
jgi:predicted phosphodiesterase